MVQNVKTTQKKKWDTDKFKDTKTIQKYQETLEENLQEDNEEED